MHVDQSDTRRQALRGSVPEMTKKGTPFGRYTNITLAGFRVLCGCSASVFRRGDILFQSLKFVWDEKALLYRLETRLVVLLAFSIIESLHPLRFRYCSAPSQPFQRAISVYIDSKPVFAKRRRRGCPRVNVRALRGPSRVHPATRETTRLGDFVYNAILSLYDCEIPSRQHHGGLRRPH